MKLKFNPEAETVWENTRNKTWDIVVDGVVVGGIETSIRDLFMSRTTPGYSVTVTAVIIGKEKPFREYSAAFSNRSSEEAYGNRAEYVRRAKAWATKYFEREQANG